MPEAPLLPEEKSTNKTHPIPDTRMWESSDDILKALKYCVAVPDGMKMPGHPSQKMATGHHTVYFMERGNLAYLIKKSKFMRSKNKKKKATKLVAFPHVPAGNFYGPKILEDLYELVGL